MIIVLVGAPLSGKTTLLKKLQERNVKVFSADTFVNNIYKAGKAGYLKIQQNLGDEFLTENNVDKRALANWAVDGENLEKLNNLIHPLIRDYLYEKDDYVAELPILVTSKIDFSYDKVILVEANNEEMINRMQKSNLSNPRFINKIISDWNNSSKGIEFDYVVNTTNGINEKDISNIIEMLNK